jgi:hypothetical protein
MDYKKIITVEPGKRNGKPRIRGLRITMTDSLEYLASGGGRLRSHGPRITQPGGTSECDRGRSWAPDPV